jgi:hypothetical protein
LRDQRADPPMIIVKVALRFENRDTSQWTVKGFDVALCQQGGKDIFGYMTKAYSLDGQEIDQATFETMLIQAGVTTRFYLLDVVLHVRDERIKTAADLDVRNFVKVTLRSNVNQSPVEAKLHVVWETALTDKGAMPIFIRDVPTVTILDGLSGL